MPLVFRITYNSAAVAAANRPKSRPPARSGGAISPFWEFVAALQNVSAGNLKGLWLPQQGNGTTTTSIPGDRVWTYPASIVTLTARQGFGVTVPFVSASSQYGDTPDTTDLTFIEPDPMSVVVLANVTDTAALRMLIGKYISTGTGGEWQLAVTSTDTLRFLVRDDSAAAESSRASDSAITQGSLHLFGVSYSGVGGASAMNGATLYSDAAVIASTATNSGTYVAMENLTNKVDVAAYSNQGAGAFLDGSLGFAAVYKANLTLAQHLEIKNAVNKFYALTL